MADGLGREEEGEEERGGGNAGEGAEVLLCRRDEVVEGLCRGAGGGELEEGRDG